MKKDQPKPFAPIHYPYYFSDAEVLIIDRFMNELRCNNKSGLIEEMITFFILNARKKDLKEYHLIELDKKVCSKFCLSIKFYFQVNMIQKAEKLGINHQELVRYSIWYAQRNNFIQNFIY